MKWEIGSSFEQPLGAWRCECPYVVRWKARDGSSHKQMFPRLLAEHDPQGAGTWGHVHLVGDDPHILVAERPLQQTRGSR